MNPTDQTPGSLSHVVFATFHLPHTKIPIWNPGAAKNCFSLLSIPTGPVGGPFDPQLDR